MTTWILLIRALPELLALVKILQKSIDEAESKRKVQDDLKTIHEAFVNNDAEKLRTLFNSN